MLSDFFRINLPYGISRNDKGEWMAFNREYMPLGYNNTNYRKDNFPNKEHFDLPIYTKYKGLTERILLKIATRDGDGIRKNEKGEIITVWLYNDGTIPLNTNSKTNPYWKLYWDKLEILSKLQVR